MIKLFAIKDVESNTTQHPFPMATKRDAIDGLRQVVNDPKTTISNHPNDFQLYYLGEYNERAMDIDTWEPEFIISASELKEDK
mgnify:CR=1 FL=1